jgi:hypothetical protein
LDARKERSKALSLAKSGGLGKTPCVKAKISTRMLTPMSNGASV